MKKYYQDTGQNWNEEELNLLKKEFEKGTSIKKISLKLNRKDDAVVFRLIKIGILGYPEEDYSKNNNQIWSENEKKQLIKEYREGKSVEEIAKKHGRNKNAILFKLIECRAFDFTDRTELEKYLYKESSEIRIPYEKTYKISLNRKKPETENKKSYFKYIIGGLFLLFIIYLFLNYRIINTKGIEALNITNNSLLSNIFPEIILNCIDGTMYNTCSDEKPLYCLNGSLYYKASLCGCPDDFKANGEECVKIQRCSDKTIFGECSLQKPFYCSDGNLIEKASICGCSNEEVISGDSCISKYSTSPKNIELKYILRGQKDKINYLVYGGLSNSLPVVSRYNCNPYICFIGKDYQLKFIDNEKQKEFMLRLVEEIKNKTSNRDDQARIAISLVQNIPYDYAKQNLNGGDFDERYPYQVLYDQEGVCGEKSKLLVFLLRELGFGTAFISDTTILHVAVGIKCPSQYSYQNSGYCFIETTSPTIITNSDINYYGLRFTNPTFTPMNDGLSFDSVSEEYKDAQEWNEIQSMISFPGQQIDQSAYDTWLNLVKKYCIQTTTGNECTMN